MGSTSLWIEISISGFFYLLALFFIILKVLGVKDLLFFDSMKDYVAITSIGVSIASYLAGILAHRLLPILIIKPYFFLKHTFRRNQISEEKSTREQHTANLVKVWQYGSARLHKEMDFQFSLYSLMLSLVVGLPLSGTSFAIWAWGTLAQESATPILVLSFVLGLAFYFALRIQRTHYQEIQRTAFEEMKTISKSKK